MAEEDDKPSRSGPDRPTAPSPTGSRSSVEPAAEPAPDASAERPAESGQAESGQAESGQAPPARRRGRPLTDHSPFYIGFFGAIGVLIALALKSILAAASSVILLIVVAMFLAVGLNPAVEFMTRRGMRRGLAVTAVFAAVLVALTVFVVTLVPVISEQVTAIVEATPQLIEQLKSNALINRLNQRFDILDRISQQVQSGALGSQLAGGVLDVGLAVLGALANTLIVAILTLYFLASLPKMKRTALRLAPASRRERVSTLGEQVLDGVGGYVSGAFVVALTAGVTSLVFLFIVGLGQYAFALAFVVMLLDLVPLIGATIAAVVVAAIGFAEDPTIGIACVIFYVVYQQIENYVVYPRVMSSSADVPGAVTVIAVLAGAALLGVIGALLAIPTAAAVLLLTREVLMRRQDAR